MFITNKTLDAKMKEQSDFILASAEAALAEGVEALRVEMVAALAVKIAELDAEMATKIETLEEDTQRRYEEAKLADRTKRYESDEPFVEIMSEHFSVDGGVQLRLDWNTSFIEYLVKNGFKGANETEIVDHWMFSLSQQRVDQNGDKSEFAK